MAKEPSFDVVSEVDMQEVNNAVNQTVKEITQRFDFKGTKSTVEIENGNAIKIVTEDDTRMRNIVDILQGKFIKRGVAIKNLEYGKVEPAAGGMVRQSIKVKQGIDADVAKKITKDIKNLKVKVQAQLQDDQIRVSGKKIDDLQAVIAFLKGQDYGVELQFSNFRS
ncbi:MAG: YajQ family cyclic di-GMP-binding protein [Peptococcaceae bacterium]|nr:YajQ family cyclic di-GMP-binding protein [Peptococcaceae bacterium]MBQ3510291.1 YajQ family cyclic di-GMP-binding protein [Peptococcaceae bacterium]